MESEEIPSDIPQVIGEYVLDRSLGSGAFGQVYLAQHPATQSAVALKCIPKAKIGGYKEFQNLKREIQIMKDMDHPFIVSFYDVFDDSNNFYIAMEVAENGNLLDYINNNKGLREQQARRIFCQIVSALKYLHLDRTVMHRDLKPENILLDRYDNIRVVDFGFSKPFSRDDPFLLTTCGTPAYIAPEIIKLRPYQASADIWSLGVILYAMVVGRLPFQDDNISILLEKIQNDKPFIPNNLSPNLKSLLTRLLNKEPLTRITLQEIMNHPWVTEFEDSRLYLTDFGPNPSFKMLEKLDSTVISEMTVLSFETTGLLQELQQGTINRRTAAYKMLRNQRIIDQIHSWQIAKASKPKARPKVKTPALHASRAILDQGKVRICLKRNKRATVPRI